MSGGRMIAVDRPSALAASADPYVSALLEKPREQLRRMASALQPRGRQHG
jgi:hypothetical protein